MRVLEPIVSAAVAVYVLIVFAVVFVVLLAVLLVSWPFVRERRHTPRTRAFLDITQPSFKPVEEVRLMPGVEDAEADVVQEGLGTTHPWGDHLTPLAYLPDAEWKLWTSVIAESAR